MPLSSREKYRQRRKSMSPFLSLEEYKAQYFSDQTQVNLVNYFESVCKVRPGRTDLMLKFEDTEYVTGCAWPGNCARFSITDYRKYKTCKGRKRIDISPVEYNYVDSPDMHELVDYPLKSIVEVIEEEKIRQKHSIYNVPRRFMDRFNQQLIVTINDQQAQKSELTDEMLQILLDEMTPGEKANYYKLINKINVDLYPCLEFPITVRIDGVDDGAKEKQFSSQEKLDKLITDWNLFPYAYNSLLDNAGFIFTD